MPIRVSTVDQISIALFLFTFCKVKGKYETKISIISKISVEIESWHFYQIIDLVTCESLLNCHSFNLNFNNHKRLHLLNQKCVIQFKWRIVWKKNDKIMPINFTEVNQKFLPLTLVCTLWTRNVPPCPLLLCITFTCLAKKSPFKNQTQKKYFLTSFKLQGFFFVGANITVI